MLGIVTALPIEGRSLSRRCRKTKKIIRLGNNVLLYAGGIGADAANTAALRLLDSGATAIMSYGSAAGLVQQVRPGTVILPKCVMHIQNTTHHADPVWHQHIHAQLNDKLNVHAGTILHAQDYIKTVADKRSYAMHGAVAADMETWVVANVASQANIPFLALRAVADAADMHLPVIAMHSIEQHTGRIKVLKMLRRLARNPRELYQLYQMYQCFSAAKSSLRQAIKTTGVQQLLPQELTTEAVLITS